MVHRLYRKRRRRSGENRLNVTRKIATFPLLSTQKNSKNKIMMMMMIIIIIITIIIIIIIIIIFLIIIIITFY